MQDFLDAVVQSLNADGLSSRLTDVNMWSATIRVGDRVSIYVSLRTRTAVFLGAVFRRTQVLEAVRHIVSRLPALAAREFERMSEEAKRRWLAPTRQQLNAAGVWTTADCTQFSVDEADRVDVAKLLLLYARAKRSDAFAGHDHHALLSAILDNPDERLPIDVYCDYLMENGREADAMKLRGYTGAETEL